MSALYSIIKVKATDPNTRNQIVYAEMPENVELSDYKKCLGFTYLDFYNLINMYIKQLKANPLITSIVFVDNSVASTAMVIAMRELGITPVLIDTSSRQILKDIPAPLVYMGNDKNKNVIDYFVQGVVVPNISKDIKGDIIICSSGSENKPHFNGFAESELLHIKNQYGEDNSTFYSYISSANISGILTNIVNPLMHNTKAVMRTGFDLSVFDPKKLEEGPEKVIFKDYLLSRRNPDLVEELFYGNWDDKIAKIVGNKLLVGKITNMVNPLDIRPIYRKLNLTIGSLEELGISIDSVMFPRDILYHLENYDCSSLDFSKLEHIYLAGGVNSRNTINKVKEKVSSIKKCELINLYGATEAGGVICTCKENKFKPCYIDASNCLNGEVIYTFDKINFFSIIQGEVKRVEGKFNEETFMEFLPVSETKTMDVSLKDDFTICFNDIEGKNKIESTDIGAIIDNQLYVLGRKSSLVTIKNKSYFLSSLEAYFTRILGADTYCILSQNEHIAIFINCGDNNLDYKINMYDKALKACNNFKSLQFNYPIILDKDSFPKIEISGKISRAQFEKYSSFAGRQNFNFRLREHSKKETLSKIVSEYLKDYEVTYLDEYQIKVNFSKSYFFDLAIVGTFFDIISFDDNKGEMVLKFNDNYMFDISAINLLLEFPDMARIKAKSLLADQIIISGVDDTTREKIEKCKSIHEPFRELDSSMSSSEIIKQLRINVAISLCDYLPADIRPFFLKGALRVGEEMMAHGAPIEEVQYVMRKVKEFIGEKKYEDIDKRFLNYFDQVLYTPSYDRSENGEGFDL